MKGGTLSISWGEWGGFYWRRHRITRLGSTWRLCLGSFAVTHVPIEIDDLLEAYANELETKQP